MQSVKFNVGDWAYHDAELMQVRKIDEDGQPIEMSDGVFSTCGWPLFAVPLTMSNKLISGEFSSVRKKMHEIDLVHLNYPDITSKLDDLWRDALAAYDPAGDNRDLYAKLHEFRRGVLDAVGDASRVDVMGVRIFRR
jgi:hypothetical protein